MPPATTTMLFYSSQADIMPNTVSKKELSFILEGREEAGGEDRCLGVCSDRRSPVGIVRTVRRRGDRGRSAVTMV